MKKVLFIILLASAAISQAQKPVIQNVRQHNLSNKYIKKIGSYITSTNDTLRVGSIISIGTPSDNGNTFAYLKQGSVATMVLLGEEMPLSGVQASKTKVKIKKLSKSGKILYVTMTAASGTFYQTYTRNIDGAFESGEFITEHKTMAFSLEKLKEALELFELGIISKDDYNKQKNDFIKKYRK